MGGLPDVDLGHGGAVVAAGRSTAYVVSRAWAWRRSWLIGLVGLNVAVALTPAAQVFAVAALVDASAGGSGEQLVVPLVTLTLLIGIGQVAGEVSTVSFQRLRERLFRRYMHELMRAIGRLTPQQLSQSETTARIEGCRDAAFDVAQMVNSVIAAAATLVTAVALCVSVWQFSPAAGVLVTVALVPGLVAYARVARQEGELFVQVHQWRRRSYYLMEQLVGQRTATELATLGTSDQIIERVDDTRRQALRLLDRMLISLTWGTVAAGLVTAALLGGALVAIVLAGGGGAGIAAGILGVIAGMAATRAGGFAYGELIKIAPKVQAYRQFTDQAADSTNAQQIVRKVSRVELMDVVVTYPGASVPALNRISIRADVGSIIALVGVNGAGKTTAINALLGIVDLQTGQIRINGEDAAAMPLLKRLGHFGLLTQEFGRYELTIRDSLRLGTPDPVTDPQIWAALDAAHLGDAVRGLPDGLDTQLGTQFKGVGLSGGQWQRMALARIHLRNAGVWVLDEPTSAIDAEAEQQIFAELQRHKAGRITIVVSHRAWTLKDMDYIYVFDHGQIVEHGRYDDLQTADGRFAQIFADQN